MTPRDSPDRERARRDWERFVAANAHQFRTAGLPALAAQSIDHWDDLLAHGRFATCDDPTRFEVRRLTEDQYLAFCALTESYFAAGYEFFPPAALRPQDATRLRARVGS